MTLRVLEIAHQILSLKRFYFAEDTRTSQVRLYLTQDSRLIVLIQYQPSYPNTGYSPNHCRKLERHLSICDLAP